LNKKPTPMSVWKDILFMRLTRADMSLRLRNWWVLKQGIMWIMNYINCFIKEMVQHACT